MKMINRTQFNDEVILKAWGMTLKDIEYLIFQKLSKRSVSVSGMYKNGERIRSLVEL